jgi:hypothetical protein
MKKKIKKDWRNAKGRYYDYGYEQGKKETITKVNKIIDDFELGLITCNTELEDSLLLFEKNLKEMLKIKIGELHDKN